MNTGSIAPLNQWTHITVVYDNGIIKTYINGGLVHTYAGSGVIGDAITAQNDLRIGGRQVTSQHFQGRIDEVRVYNRALSASEVATLPNGSGMSTQINWLVSDHLGTPRIIIDQTGTLANVKRHDYLPFGEELFVNRTSGLGYGGGDGVRQQFTAKERDIETGLDYFINRYYSSPQGRFTSADPIPMTSQRPSDPQRLNLYAYVRGNPLTNIDPNGLDLYATGEEAERYKKDLEKATKLKLKLDSKTGKITIDGKLPKNMSDAAKQIQKIIGDSKNTVTVNAIRDSSPHDYVGGKFEGGGKQTINYADVDALSKKGGFDARAGAVHETTEAYAGLLDPSKSAREHHLETGIPYENKVRQDLGLGRRVPSSETGGLTFGNETFVTVDYTTHLEHYKVVQTGQGKFVIKDVVVEKKKQ
jgi:RHS repeat-associated protein